jgi:uncharacterized protein (DUF433 family)
MSMVQEAEDLLARLSPAEKAEVVQSVIRDIGGVYPGIESNPDVVGGDPCIVRTRIPVWLLEQARRLGASEADLLADYPSLRAQDLVNAWAYARAHRDEIDRLIEEHEAA